MYREPRTMVISLMKAGTHLVQELMLALDYKVVGVPRPTPQAAPVFDTAQLKAISALVLDKTDYEDLLETEGTVAFREQTGQTWSALLWHWQKRLGQQVINRYGQTKLDFAESVISNPFLPYTRFADTPAGLCWILHELDISRMDGSFVGEWIRTSSPPLIFNYRDPRDTIISMINFLEGRTKEGYGNFYEADLWSSILAGKPTWEAKIDYALRDRSFIGHDQFEKALWLYNHPQVCNVRYEDLVGPQGGGSRERQIGAVRRVLEHVGSLEDPEVVADKVYNRESWSFYRGRTGGWRERFTQRNLDQFKEQYGDLVEQFDYE